MFDWFRFNPNETDTTTFEVSNDEGDQIVFTVPTKGSNKIRKALRQADIPRDTDDFNSRSSSPKIVANRSPDGLRWWGQRDIDEKEEVEWQGDQEGGAAGTDEDDDREGCDPRVDDEESEQAALRFWPKW